MNPAVLKQRTMQFTVRVLKLADALPGKRLKELRTEAEELTEIFNATRTTARNHNS